jgi:hypothetical protein
LLSASTQASVAKTIYREFRVSRRVVRKVIRSQATDFDLPPPDTKRCRAAQMATYLRRTDQDLERTAKAATPARDDLVMHLFLRRSHFGRADLSVTVI